MSIAKAIFQGDQGVDDEAITLPAEAVGGSPDRQQHMLEGHV